MPRMICPDCNMSYAPPRENHTCKETPMRMDVLHKRLHELEYERQDIIEELEKLERPGSWKWELIYTLPNNGHKLYLDETSGRISICDWSGELPHETDDGVLWLDVTRPIILTDNHGVMVPVVNPEGGESSTPMSFNNAVRMIAVMEKFGYNPYHFTTPGEDGLHLDFFVKIV